MPVKRKSDIEKLAEELMPGWRSIDAHMENDPSEPITARDAGAQRSRADSTMPSIEKLRAKYGTKKSDSLPRGGGYRDSQPDDSDTAIVRVESGPLRKTVAISPSQRKVLWSQG